jgi:nicotinate-nucleotide adenylyltransferase
LIFVSMKIGLYFGSFNPVHIGHLIIANFVANNTDNDQVWMIVSPQNPLKPSSSLLNEYHRLHLLQLAIDDNPKLKAVDFEFKLPRPSYTIDTLSYLSDRYPQHEFSIIIGSDSYQNIHQWKNYEALLKHYRVLVYNRPGFSVEKADKGNVRILSAPLLDISASMIRNMIKEKKSIQYIVPDKARFEIEINNYYR